MYKATKSFVGVVSMVRGEVRDLEPEVAKDLIKAGYVIDLGAKQKKALCSPRSIRKEWS